MSIVYIGSLPVSAVNIGIAAAPPVLTAEITRLQLDISGLIPAIAAQLELQVSLPSLPQIALALGFAIDPTVLAALLNPATWLTASAGFSLDLTVQLGLIDLQIALTAELVASFEVGLSAPGIAGWSYSGSASGFGERLRAQTSTGFGRIQADEEVSGVIVATSAFTSWQAFSLGFNVGRSADVEMSNQTDESRLTFLGVLGGQQWATGVFALLARIKLSLLELQALRASLAVQLRFALGLDIPDISGLISFAAGIDIELAFPSISAGLDIQLSIDGIQLRIEGILELVADLQLQLSAGGLSVWTYRGPALGLGAEFEAQISGGLPGVPDGPQGAVYGLALASKFPAAWASFGRIFGSG